MKHLFNNRLPFLAKEYASTVIDARRTNRKFPFEGAATALLADAATDLARGEGAKANKKDEAGTDTKSAKPALKSAAKQQVRFVVVLRRHS